MNWDPFLRVEILTEEQETQSLQYNETTKSMHKQTVLSACSPKKHAPKHCYTCKTKTLHITIFSEVNQIHQ